MATRTRSNKSNKSKGKATRSRKPVPHSVVLAKLDDGQRKTLRAHIRRNYDDLAKASPALRKRENRSRVPYPDWPRPVATALLERFGKTL